MQITHSYPISISIFLLTQPEVAGNLVTNASKAWNVYTDGRTTWKVKTFLTLVPQSILCLQCFDVVGWAAGRASKKTEWWGAGVVLCLERTADLHTAQLMPLPLTVSCFSKIQIGFTFLVRAHPGSPRKRAVKRVRGCPLVYTSFSRITDCNFTVRMLCHNVYWLLYIFDLCFVFFLCTTAVWQFAINEYVIRWHLLDDWRHKNTTQNSLMY